MCGLEHELTSRSKLRSRALLRNLKVRFPSSSFGYISGYVCLVRYRWLVLGEFKPALRVVSLYGGVLSLVCLDAKDLGISPWVVAGHSAMAFSSLRADVVGGVRLSVILREADGAVVDSKSGRHQLLYTCVDIMRLFCQPVCGSL